MKKVLFLLFAFNIFGWVSPVKMAFSSDGQPLAVVISVEGTAKIRSRNTSYPATEKIELYEGDVITTDRLSRVILLYLGEELIRIPEEKKLRITAAELSVPEQGTFAELKYILSAAYTGMKSSIFPQPVLSSPGAARKWLRLREAEIIDLLQPVATKVLTSSPHFKWLPLKGVKTYELTLVDGLGDVIWRHETTRTELAYPKEAPVLVPEQYYFWRVRRADETAWESHSWDTVYLTTEMAYFTVMHEERREEIRQQIKEARQVVGTTQDEVFHLLLGLYYEKKQLYGEAQGEYQTLLTLQPANEIYKHMLASLYIKIGRKWAAADVNDYK
ncbi:MAG: hypothetical protein GY801_41875 [bacterium]|nr:hypothetical protein [bacterium]